MPKQIPQLVATSDQVYPKPRPIGVYDPGILCSQCEPLFSPYDDYGYRFFHPETQPEPVYVAGTPIAYQIKNVDYAKLKLFIISVLWRASVSSQEFYAQVSLGRYEKIARTHLLSSDPGGPDDFPVFFERFTHPAELIPILCPISVRIDGIRFYELTLNGYLVLVKVDRRPVPSELEKIVLRPREPLVILPKEYEGSTEREIMAAAVRYARFRA